MRPKLGKDDDLMSLVKVSIVRDEIRQQEEHQRRGKELKDRDGERKRERARGNAKAKRHDSMLHIMMMMVCNNDSSSSLQ